MNIGKIREKEFIKQYTAVNPGTGRETMSVRLYRPRNLRTGMESVYAIVWDNRNGHDVTAGKAGGCGYDKQGAAVSAALESVDGAGDCTDRESPVSLANCGEVRKAVEALNPGCIIVEAHA